MIKLLLFISVLASCSIDTGGKHEISDSEQIVTVKTELTVVLELCSIIKDDVVVPFDAWESSQHECWALMSDYIKPFDTTNN